MRPFPDAVLQGSLQGISPELLGRSMPALRCGVRVTLKGSGSQTNGERLPSRWHILAGGGVRPTTTRSGLGPLWHGSFRIIMYRKALM